MIVFHISGTDTSDMKTFWISWMLHMMHIPDFLGLTHFAHGVKCPKILDFNTDPPFMRNTRLAPLSHHICLLDCSQSTPSCFCVGFVSYLDIVMVSDFHCLSLVCCLQSLFTKLSHAFENLVGGLGPDNRLGLRVVGLDIVTDNSIELIGAAEYASTNLLFGEQREPALDHGDPPRASGREVQVEPQSFSLTSDRIVGVL